jgi:hypothetical protein
MRVSRFCLAQPVRLFKSGRCHVVSGTVARGSVACRQNLKICDWWNIWFTSFLMITYYTQTSIVAAYRGTLVGGFGCVGISCPFWESRYHDLPTIVYLLPPPDERTLLLFIEKKGICFVFCCCLEWLAVRGWCREGGVPKGPSEKRRGGGDAHNFLFRWALQQTPSLEGTWSCQADAHTHTLTHRVGATLGLYCRWSHAALLMTSLF